MGHLARDTLAGFELGSIITLSMVLDSLLDSEMDDILVWADIQSRFTNLPASEILAPFYKALLGVCDLAICYDEQVAHTLVESILTLSKEEEFLN